MRILSQTGIVDLPYERIGISRNDTEIVATPISDSNPQERYWTLAEYSTEEKARKAMEMLHEVYIAHENYKKLDGDVQIEVSIRAGIEKAIMYGGIFQFPSDGEAEE